jgi:hypothetical protein
MNCMTDLSSWPAWWAALVNIRRFEDLEGDDHLQFAEAFRSLWSREQVLEVPRGDAQTPVEVRVRLGKKVFAHTVPSSDRRVGILMGPVPALKKTPSKLLRLLRGAT